MTAFPGRRGSGVGGGATLAELHPDPQSAYPSAMAGNAAQLRLTGSSNYASVPYAAALDITSAITIEWRGVLHETSTKVETLVEHPFTSHDAPHYVYGLYVNRGNQAVRFDLAIGGVRNVLNVSGIHTIGRLEPIHIAGTYDGTTQRIFVNGWEVASQALSGNIDTVATDLFFGRHGNITSEAADATHDEIRLWNTARTKEDIFLNQDRQLVGTETGLVGLWLFNEGSGATIADETSNNLTASVTGSGTWDTATYTWDGTNDEKHHIPATLNLATYDGSGESVDPSVVYVPGGLNGYNWWMAVTPYENQNEDLENPSILASNNGIDWEVPTGVTNPIFGPTGDPDSHLADTCLLIINNDGTKELWLYWTYYHKVNDVVELRYSKSLDGVNWDAEKTLITDTLSVNNYLSPAIFHDGDKFVMLTVNSKADQVERRTSANGISWNAPANVTVNGLGTRVSWHLDAEIIGGTVHILFTSATDSLGASPRLHYATSTDGGATINVNDFLTQELRSFEEYQYQGSLVLDPVTQDRWWVFYSTRKGPDNAWIWYSTLMTRRLKTGELYQENALP